MLVLCAQWDTRATTSGDRFPEPCCTDASATVLGHKTLIYALPLSQAPSMG